ncbi:Uu.00g047150.m01.CDS01 [Anthostomella pinea]|uniref:Uu.00g047150.m01.CDS01 n=1 Tax=Anthostomella pinea TaxID=933095 RepID=A0AAI8VC07_9PEZI|nr:Uu.00g047150.m01.CDS01 [Anthostomella pinea]
MDTHPLMSCVEQLTPDLGSDVVGKGLFIGFLGAAYLAFLLLLGHYLLGFEPERYPFASANRSEGRGDDALPLGRKVESHEGSKDGEAEGWNPNPVDAVFLSWIRGCAKSVLAVLGVHRFLAARCKPIVRFCELALLTLSDTQALTGLALLTSAALYALPQGLNATNWQYILHLCWFPLLTYLAAHTALRGHMRSRPWQRVVRLSVLVVFTTCFIAASLPTTFFNWEYDDGYAEVSAAMPQDPALCLFDMGSAKRRFYELVSERCEEGNDYFRACTDREYLAQTEAFQFVLFGAVVLGLGVVVRTVKLFAGSSETLNARVRQPAGNLMEKVLKRVCAACGESSAFGVRQGARLASLENVDAENWVERRVGPVEVVCTALAFTLRLQVDLLCSTLAEIYYSLVLLVWDTLRIMGSKPTTGSDPATQWSCAQFLPVLLFVAPLLAALSIALSNSASRTASTTPTPQDVLRVAHKPAKARSPSPSTRRKRDLIPYHPSPYLGPALFNACGALVAVTVVFFGASFNFSLGYRPQYSIYEVLFKEFSLFPFVLFSLPVACFIVLLAGIGYGLWKTGRDEGAGDGIGTWSRKERIVYLLLGAAVYAVI